MRTEPTHRWCALAACALALAWPLPASAFCRTTTVGIPADYTPDTQGCWGEGHPLYWKNACVSYDLQKEASRQVSYDAAANAIALAFTRWTSSTCATNGMGTSRVAIDVRDLGPVNCNSVQYNQSGPNQHVIAFRDDAWPHQDSSNTLALTTVTFDPDTGEIYDADVEINSHDVMLTVVQTPTDPVPPGGYDFLSIVTHEMGHFLGMAHSADTHATMFAHYTPGSTAMRLLTQDDVTGICTIYPPDGTRTGDPVLFPPNGAVPEDACDPTPRHGFTVDCAGKPPKSGCSVVTASGPGSQTGGVGLLLAALGAVLALRRRR
jgi:MYXO-CTERM domain-containing protein